MKRFILKIIIFCVLAFCLDCVVGIQSAYFQKHAKAGTTARDNYIMNAVDEDIIIMGSSRASHHYISNLLRDTLNMSVYNAGTDGKGIILNYGLLLEILRYHKPSKIIYEFTPDFDINIGDNDKYLPHLRLAYDIPGIDSIFWKVNKSEKIKMFSKSYRSNSLVPHLLYDNYFGLADSLNGYIPQYGKITEKSKSVILKKYDEGKKQIDPIKRSYLNKYIELCKENNIDLIFAISPDLYHPSSFYDYVRNLCKENELLLIDSYQTKNFEDIALYQDLTHLNDDGAYKYSEWIVPYISKN